MTPLGQRLGLGGEAWFGYSSELLSCLDLYFHTPQDCHNTTRSWPQTTTTISVIQKTVRKTSLHQRLDLCNRLPELDPCTMSNAGCPGGCPHVARAYNITAHTLCMRPVSPPKVISTAEWAAENVLPFHVGTPADVGPAAPDLKVHLVVSE